MGRMDRTHFSRCIPHHHLSPHGSLVMKLSSRLTGISMSFTPSKRFVVRCRTRVPMAYDTTINESVSIRSDLCDSVGREKGLTEKAKCHCHRQIHIDSNFKIQRTATNPSTSASRTTQIPIQIPSSHHKKQGNKLSALG